MGNPGSQKGLSSYASHPCTPTARSVQQTRIHQTRILFGRPSIFTLSRQWLWRVPWVPRNVTISATGLASGTSFLSAQASVWNNAGPHDPVETRITALEKNLIE